MKFRFILLAALSVVASVASLSAAQPFRLYEIFVERVIADTSGALIFDRGRLNAQGEFKHDIYAQISPTVKIPAEARNLNLLPFTMWPAYDALGTEALANFSLLRTDVSNLGEGGFFTFGGESYFVVNVSTKPKLDVGNLLNLSTRGAIAPGGEPLIGGFVIDDHPRRVLVRGIGPALRGFGVTAPLANPVIRIYRQGEQSPLATNDDWGQPDKTAEIEAATTTVGAFALTRGSKDAALLIELPPGVYTAQVGSADATGGTALMEIYTVP